MDSLLNKPRRGSSPHKRKGSPYWWVRRTVPGLGVLRLSTRTKSEALARRYDAMVCDFRQLGRFDALRALQRKEATFADLCANQRPDKLDGLLAKAKSPLVRALVDEWLAVGADETGIRDRSMLRYASSWKRLNQVLSVEATLTDLTQEFVREFKLHRSQVAKALGTKLSPATLNRDLAALGAFLTWCAQERGLVVARPRLKYQAESKGRLRYLTRDELTTFRQYCPQDWWPLFGLLFSTGITISEALGLRRADIDMSAGRLSIHEQYGRKLKRTSRNRELHIDSAFRPVLDGWFEMTQVTRPEDRVFRFSYWPARKAWVRVCKAGDIFDATIHDARHTFAVHAVQNGIPEARLQKLLGHAHPGTTRRYAMHAPEAFVERDATTVSQSLGIVAPPLCLAREA
jgi:integrase